MRDLECILNETYRNLAMFIRDLSMSKDIFDLYCKGDVVTEPSFVDMTYKIGGVNAIHNTRFIILSSRASDMTELEEGTSWGLHIIHTHAYFKVLDTFVLDGISMIVLLHIKREDILFFKNNEISVDESLLNDIMVEMKSSLTKEVISSLNSDLWYKRVNYPIGIKEDGTFFKDDEKIK